MFNLTNNKKYHVIDNGQNNIGNYKEYAIIFGRGVGNTAFYMEQKCLNSGVFNLENSPEYNVNTQELTGGDATIVDYEVYHVIMEE